MDAAVAELIRRRDWLAARNIAYVVAVVPEKFTIYPEHLPAWVTRVSAAVALRSRRRRALQAFRRRSDRPASGRCARRKTPRSRLLHDRLALEFQRRGRRLRGDHARGAARAAAASLPAWPARHGRPTSPGVDFYSGDLRDHARIAAARSARTTSRRSAKCWRDARAPLRAGAWTAARFSGFEVYACDDGRDCRAQSSITTRWRFALIPLLSENFSRVVFASAPPAGPPR